MQPITASTRKRKLRAAPHDSVSRESFADAELGEDDAEHLLDVDRSGNLAEGLSGQAQFLCPHLRASTPSDGPAKTLGGLAEQCDVAGSGGHQIVRAAQS